MEPSDPHHRRADGPNAPHLPAAEGSPSAAGQTLQELWVLLIGLFVGFFWQLYNTWNGEFDEAPNVIIGLIIIIGFMLRYLWLAHRRGHGSQEVAMRFFRELAVFFIGLIIGFFWYAFYQNGSENSRGFEVHVIILLLVLIFALGRYMHLLHKHGTRRRD